MKLLAWIEHPADTTDCIGAFIAAGTTREPAWRRFATEGEARAWVEAEAAALRVPVSWGVQAAARHTAQRLVLQLERDLTRGDGQA